MPPEPGAGQLQHRVCGGFNLLFLPFEVGGFLLFSAPLILPGSMTVMAVSDGAFRAPCYRDEGFAAGFACECLC